MKSMRLNLIIVVALIALAVGGTILFDSMRPPVADSETAPGFSVADMKGKTRSLEEFRGKIVILNFWATWCAPCLAEFPKLLEIAERHKEDAVLLAVSSDVNDKLIHDFLKKLKIPENAANIVVVRDTQDIAGELFHTYKIPETFVIDRSGKIRAKFKGAEWQPQELESYIE